MPIAVPNSSQESLAERLYIVDPVCAFPEAHYEVKLCSQILGPMVTDIQNPIVAHMLWVSIEIKLELLL